MALNWTDFALDNMYDIVKYTQLFTSKMSNAYLDSLTNYVHYLESSPFLGKILLEFGIFNVRQLIYKKHRVLYYLKDNCVYVLSLIHTSRDLDNYSFYLKRLFH